MTPSCCGACDTERAVSAILINVRCPKPEEAEGFMRSGAEPEWPEEMKAQHRRLWPLLSSLEQQLLANWRAKHFRNGPASDAGCVQQLSKLLRVVEAEGTLSPTAKRKKQNAWQTAISRALTRLFALAMAR